MIPIRILSAILLLIAIHPAPSAGQTAAPVNACAMDWDSVQTLVRRDYAGFRDKTAAPGRMDALAALTDSVHAIALAAPRDSACTAALARWTGWFGDNHLQLWQPQPSPSPAPTTAAAPAPDPGPASIRFVDDSTAVLELRDFGQRHKAFIDSLVAAHYARLAATPYLLVDVRRNGGGWTESYASVLPLIQTGPIRVDGMEGWVSEGNMAYVRGMLESPRTPAQLKDQLRPIVARMQDSVGRFVSITGDTVLHFDRVHPLPRVVGVLVSRGCASSCEQFVLDARQSRKVVVMGTGNTRGMMDYGNARGVGLPSGLRRMMVPSSRSMRLPETPLDATGIVPAIRVPEGESDPVAWAIARLRERGASSGERSR